MGDIYLVAFRGAGVAGAALATAAAQYIGAAYFLWHLRRKGQEKDGIPLRFTVRGWAGGWMDAWAGGVGGCALASSLLQRLLWPAPGPCSQLAALGGHWSAIRVHQACCGILQPCVAVDPLPSLTLTQTLPLATATMA